MKTSMLRCDRALVVLSTVCFLAGCAFDAQELPEDNTDVQSSPVTQNGASLNGASLNGASLNGASLNGASLNGASLNGASLNGASLNGVALQGSNLTSVTSKGTVLSGSQLIGAEFTTTLADGRTVLLQIEDHEAESTKYPNDKIHRYVVKFTLPDETNEWAYVCGTQDGEPLRAIPLRGTWNHGEGVPGGGSKINDPTAITFACEHYALYKCVELGYEPWIGVSKKLNLGNHHQACTRMIRADYCGDGQSWTVNGTLVNVYDALGIQKDTENWDIEAEWNTNGATCLSHQRIQDLDTVPSCSFWKSPTTCGTKVKWSKTLLVSEAL
ncbi:MAG: pentapeptide repeat-containing protein [Polyangiaceae bacterium]|nr:pentapeptide repeat-containing protein [Polyangiaceae bacterium]